MIALPIGAGAMPTSTQKTGAAPVRPAALTREEKQILKDREVLENLELLQDLDKIRLLPLLSEPKKAAQPQTKSVKPAGKDNGTQKKQD